MTTDVAKITGSCLALQQQDASVVEALKVADVTSAKTNHLIAFAILSTPVCVIL